MMRKLIFLLSVAVVASCNIIIQEPDYDWKLSVDKVVVSTDKVAIIDVVGDNIPEGIQYRVEPEGIVDIYVYPNSNAVKLEYISNGEGELIASYQETEQRISFKAQKYSDTGFHLLVNGEDVYLPIIELTHLNGDRVFEYPIPEDADTITVEIIDYLPSEMEDMIVIRSIGWQPSDYKNVSEEYLMYSEEVNNWLSVDDVYCGIDKWTLPNFAQFKRKLITRNWMLADDPEKANLKFYIQTNYFEIDYLRDDWESTAYVLRFVKEEK